MSLLLHGDCLEQLSNVDDNSVDLIFCDLPYGQTSCKWDIIIPWKPFWDEIMRVKKLNTPIFFTTTTKFGVELINNAPKKCPFRYDLVWVKSAPAGFLSAKKMPMRKHEMVYAFYEKLPFYDLSSHKHKFIKTEKQVVKEEKKATMINGTLGGAYDSRWQKGHQGNSYDPPLPVSVVKEEDKGCYGEKVPNSEAKYGQKCARQYDPPLPTSVVKQEDTVYGDLPTTDSYAEGVGLGKKGHETRYDPPLPTSVVKQVERKSTYGNIETHDLVIGETTGQPRYDPPLPTTMLEIKSTRGKHSTEKPVALMEWILKYYSKEGDVVLDPTMGSGSTGVACKNMNRNFIGIEKDPEIYQVAVNRIED